MAKRTTSRISPSPAAPIPILGRHIDLKNDLATLIVSPTLDQEKNVRFFALPKDARLPTQFPSSLLAIGFPADGTTVFYLQMELCFWRLRPRQIEIELIGSQIQGHNFRKCDGDRGAQQ